MTTATRSRDYLAELADAVRELTEPRKPETRYEVREQNKRGNWKRSRRTHRVQLPSLLDSLADAMSPGSDGDVLLAGSFESQPSADMGAIHTAARIQREALQWARDLDVSVPKTLPALLPLLVSAGSASGPRLVPLCNAAKSWVRSARLATGYDNPYQPSAACPECGKTHTLVAEIDPKDESRSVYCRSCKFDWDETTIGILTRMIEENQTLTTLAVFGPCEVSPECQVRGDHVQHQDGRGRYWPTTGLGGSS